MAVFRPHIQPGINEIDEFFATIEAFGLTSDEAWPNDFAEEFRRADQNYVVPPMHGTTDSYESRYDTRESGLRVLSFPPQHINVHIYSDSTFLFYKSTGNKKKNKFTFKQNLQYRHPHWNVTLVAKSAVGVADITAMMSDVTTADLCIVCCSLNDMCDQAQRYHGEPDEFGLLFDGLLNRMKSAARCMLILGGAASDWGQPPAWDVMVDKHLNTAMHRQVPCTNGSHFYQLFERHTDNFHFAHTDENSKQFLTMIDDIVEASFCLIPPPYIAKI
jgi:hypothetical protein